MLQALARRSFGMIAVMTPPPTSPTGAPAHPAPLMRGLRYLYRVPMLLWHVLVDLPVVLLMMPLSHGRMVGGERLDHRLIRAWSRSEEHTSELQSLMRISYAVFCLQKKNKKMQTA